VVYCKQVVLKSLLQVAIILSSANEAIPAVIVRGWVVTDAILNSQIGASGTKLCLNFELSFVET
jgi:hypothetical protein